MLTQTKGTQMKIGDKVWYQEFSGTRRAATITGFGNKDGETVIEVRVEDATDRFDEDRWGYVDQITPRREPDEQGGVGFIGEVRGTRQVS
jgi:hypothetical protein